VSIVTDILDRLSGIGVLRERVNDLTGQLKALIQMQAQGGKR
jgi:hypothetical protein